MQEIDVQTLKKSSKIVVDTLEGALHEAGDFLVPMKNNEWKEDSIHGEIGEIICGKIESRREQTEITVYKSVGTAYLDTMVAVRVYKKALLEGVGVKVDI